MKILPRISESCPIKKECDNFLTFATLILTNSHQYTWKYYRELVRVVSLKMNSNVYPLKSTNSH